MYDGSAASAKLWQNELSFFNDLPTGEVYTDMINKYREAKRPLVARSSLTAIIMPSERLMKKMEIKGFKNFEQMEAAVEAVRAQYILLFNDPDEFQVNYPSMAPDDILDVMESTVSRLSPSSVAQWYSCARVNRPTTVTCASKALSFP